MHVKYLFSVLVWVLWEAVAKMKLNVEQIRGNAYTEDEDQEVFGSDFVKNRNKEQWW